MGASSRRFDVLVVGAGPAGSTAALVLARGGARVALVDRAPFPRDKACGDLVGPRGLAVMSDLGVVLPPGIGVGDMVVSGPTGRQVRLPAVAGSTYPGSALAVRRMALDACLRQAAVEAGAEPITAHLHEPLWAEGRLDGFACGQAGLRADVVIGADGATSRVAAVAGMVEPSRVLWGFAVRWYSHLPADLPAIAWWEPTPGRPLPGYGWVFPGPGGTNIGLGIGSLADRRQAPEVVRSVGAFTAHLRRTGLLPRADLTPSGRLLGGWLKMGMVGTLPARGRVLLAGDAAGLVNPLQGEGIGQAMTSGRAAALAVLAGPGSAARHYLAALYDRHARYQTVAVTAHRSLVSHPRVLAGVSRTLTAPGVGRALSGGWALLWNDLVDGAPAGVSRALARVALAVGGVAANRGPTRRWFDGLADGPPSDGEPAWPDGTPV